MAPTYNRVFDQLRVVGLIVVIAIGVVYLFSLAGVWSPADAQDLNCNSKYSNGNMPRRSDFDAILQEHQQWLSLYREKVGNTTAKERADKRRANLCNANLRRPVKLEGVDLSGANLRGATFEGNNLTGMKLKGADLGFANMRGTFLKDVKLGEAYTSFIDLAKANLIGADLSHSSYDGSNLNEVWFASGNMERVGLQGVTMRNAALPKVNLRRSFMLNVDLSGANLAQADLSGSIMTEVNLSNARMGRANLENVVIRQGIFNNTFFEPENAHSLMIMDAKGLSTIEFSDPRPIMQLRKNIKESGLRSEERALTSALRKFELKTAPIYERYIQHGLLGGWVTDYGAKPWGSFVVLLLLIPVFSVAYAMVVNSQGHAAIWAVWPTDSLPEYRREPVRVTAAFFARNAGDTELSKLRHWLSLIHIALYFSLLAAFRIGWRELNVGSWISRLQGYEYNLRAVGWVRTMSGVQSLLSVYLLALWALTYFGRLFE